MSRRKGRAKPRNLPKVPPPAPVARDKPQSKSAQAPADVAADAPASEPKAIAQDHTDDLGTTSDAELSGNAESSNSAKSPNNAESSTTDPSAEVDDAPPTASIPEPESGPSDELNTDRAASQTPAKPALRPEPPELAEVVTPPARRAVLPAGSAEVVTTTESPAVPEVQAEPQPEPQPELEPQLAATPKPTPAPAAEPEPRNGQVITPSQLPRPVTRRTTRLAWARIRRAAHPKISRAQLLASALVAVLGFALVAQITQHGDQRLTGLRPSELVQILDNLNDRRDRLNDEKADLEAERRQLTSGTSGSQAAIAAAQSRLDALGILAGTVSAEGPGIQVTIRDPSGAVPPPRLLDLVQELRDAGAEVIQLGTARVVANTAFTDVPGGGVAVNGVRQKSPYVVLAIGDSQTMATAMQIPGGAIASLPPGVTGSVTEQSAVRITALRPVPSPRYAQPATTATPTR